MPADRAVSFVDSVFRKFLLERMFRSVSGFPERRLCAGRVELFVSFGSRVPVKILYVGSGQFVFLLLFRCRCDGQFELLEPCHGGDVQGCDIAVHVAVVSCQGDHRGVVGRDLNSGRKVRLPRFFPLRDAVAEP